MKCHQDIYNDHFHSAHKFSSFNNPAYLFSVRETREVALKRDGNVQAVALVRRLPRPGAVLQRRVRRPELRRRQPPDRPRRHHLHRLPRDHARQQHRSATPPTPSRSRSTTRSPSATNPTLQWVNNQLVKAKPDFHKKTFLKPFHKTAEFCSTCHKVRLPVELNHYKDFLRGQNHYDTFLLSGVSGHGARSFYYPPQAKENCADCHMPLKPSRRLRRKDFDGSGDAQGPQPPLPGGQHRAARAAEARAAVQAPAPTASDEAIEKNADFLRGTDPDGQGQEAPHRPVRPEGRGGRRRTTADRPAAAGTADAEAGQVVPGRGRGPHARPRPPLHAGDGRLQRDLGRLQGDDRRQGDRPQRGAGRTPDDTGPVDPWSHFINVSCSTATATASTAATRRTSSPRSTTTRSRRGPAQVVHYRLDVPADVTGPVELTVRLRYRKFDYEYMKLVHKDGAGAEAADRGHLRGHGDAAGRRAGPTVPAQESPIKPAWQRWNDYGIGCLSKAGRREARADFKQAEAAFQKLLTLGVHGRGAARPPQPGPRLHRRGPAATPRPRELDKAEQVRPAGSRGGAGLVQRRWSTARRRPQGHSTRSIADLEKIVDPGTASRGDRGFDFTQDYVVLEHAGEPAVQASRRSSSRVDAATRGSCARSIETAERCSASTPRTSTPTTCWRSATPSSAGGRTRPCATPEANGDVLTATWRTTLADARPTRATRAGGRGEAACGARRVHGDRRRRYRAAAADDPRG